MTNKTDGWDLIVVDVQGNGTSIDMRNMSEELMSSLMEFVKEHQEEKGEWGYKTAGKNKGWRP